MVNCRHTEVTSQSNLPRLSTSGWSECGLAPAKSCRVKFSFQCNIYPVFSYLFPTMSQEKQFENSCSKEAINPFGHYEMLFVCSIALTEELLGKEG